MAERTFNLPDLGEGLEEAEIVEWKVSAGDTVELNQPLVDVNTAKALVEIPSPWAGTIVKTYGSDGEVLKVGEPLVTIDVGGEAEAGAAPPTDEPKKREAVLVGYGVDQETKSARRRRLRPPGPRQAPAAASAVSADTGAAYTDVEPQPSPPAGRALAAPPVRKLAKELGVDLSTIAGSGPNGRVRREDVEAAAGRGTAPPTPLRGIPITISTGSETRVPLRGVRRLIAEKMARSWAEVPHVTTFHVADATNVEALRRELTEEAGAKVTALAVVVRAFAEICTKHPELNARHDPEANELVLHGSKHVGIATDTDEGLVVPVVRDVQAKGIVTVAREIAGLVEAARTRRATPDQLTGGTVTVTNVGTFGSDFGTPIINVPEVAILALGTIKHRPLVVDGSVVARPTVTLSLSFDHRFIDGAHADRAMTDLRKLLESPFKLGALPRG
ncbi:MAG TPA: dihydrolipoamide acetyltransferase family protein [Actinomycetota bacterium]|nr:dihydrolipoamide acetyltransferase family protein [Actinomycetota bacterium]